MSLRSPLGKVLGTGSAKEGVHHWWLQRLTSIALIPLAIWFVVSAFGLIGADRDMAMTFFKSPVNSVLMALFVIAALVHMVLGLQMIIEDYVHGEGAKIVLLVLNKFFAWLVGAACLFALIRIAV